MPYAAVRVLALGLTGQQFACLALLVALAVYYGQRLRPARVTQAA